MTPTQRALRVLEREGHTAQVVERWNPYARVRVDFLGIIDVVACHPQHGILGVQTTSMSNTAAHVQKALGESVKPRLIAWLRAGARFEIWGFSKRSMRSSKTGAKLTRWMLRRKRVTVALLEGNWTLQVHEWEAPEL